MLSPTFRRNLLAWYDTNARDLPWRRTDDPYRIWISEIMLQQTRVTAVLDYYARFLNLFPTVEALAKAKEPEVLAAWSGLGYYRRARQMHKAAQTIVQDHNGRLPKTAEALRTLPGIGPYTSAAIASIAYGEPTAVVDGNVERVLLRLFGEETATVPKTWFRDQANSLLDPSRPGDFNQSMMELGATTCLPSVPYASSVPSTASAPPGESTNPPRRKKCAAGKSPTSCCAANKPEPRT